MGTTTDLSNQKIFLIVLPHVAVGIAVVIISSFVNSELKFQNWDPSLISFYLGGPIIFEIFRLYFGHLYDEKNKLKSSFLLGTLLSTLGLITIQFGIFPIGNSILIVAISLFYFGSAIMTTLVDSYLLDISSTDSRRRIAGFLQTFRLIGFAIGGIFGSVLYAKLDFALFLYIIAIMFLMLSLITFYSMEPILPTKRKENSFFESISKLINLLRSRDLILMSLFLIIYPIGLFMQDLILEPFAIGQFNFDKDSIGIVVRIWTTTTLIFVPVGVYLESKISTLFPVILGEIIASLGLVIFIFTPKLDALNIFYLGLILFGLGIGISSAPAIRLMLDVCYSRRSNLALLLAYFGILTTLGRTLSSLTGGLILLVTSENYSILFAVETLFLLASIIPITIIYYVIKELKIEKSLQTSLTMD